MEKKKDKINFEENIKKLETIVRELESGNVALDDALDKFNELIKTNNNIFWYFRKKQKGNPIFIG